ncbi:MAG: hypothetical protein II811_06595 [Spirochaetaceae bacterium]|nr:hypothetical protein [Spirochaetaceae bacterium]
MSEDLKIIALMGIKHCGKTTQGKRLAAFYDCLFFDTDDVIFQQTGKTAREIYSNSGKDAFMKAESEACKSIVKQLETLRRENYKMPYAVISTGGGFCNNEEAKAILKEKSTFVFMKTDESVASDRIVKEIEIGTNGELKGLPAYIASKKPKTIEEVRSVFHDFYEERSALYSAMADIVIELPQASKEENTQRLINALNKVRNC